MSINSKMTAIADAIRSKTGDTAKLSLDAMVEAIAGIEASGSEAIGTPDTLPSVTGLFYALTSGNYKTGKFTLAEALPNTETLIFSSGLAEIKGVLIVVDGFPDVHEENASQRIGSYLHFPTISPVTSDGFVCNTYTIALNLIPNTSTRNNGILNGDRRIDGGDFYVTAKYNKNFNYTPFAPSYTYTWIVW